MKVAVPVKTQEGLCSIRAEQFGHAPHFVVAELEDGKLVGGGLFDSISHEEFGCAGIAEYVASALGADAVIVKQISHDAFAWLHDKDVDVCQELEEVDAAGALRRYLWGQIRQVDASMCSTYGH